MTKSRKRGAGYGGNCRMIEIGSPGIPFRLAVNVDHIDNIRFEELFEERDFPVSSKDAFTDKDGVEHPAIPIGIAKKVVSVGWSVLIISNGQQSGLNLPTMAAAMGCYNSIINMIQAVGIPHVFMGPLRPPEESKIVGIDGEKIEAAVDAADLHPDLAGGEGAGIAENDDAVAIGDLINQNRIMEADQAIDDLDDEFELSDEDVELLANPVIDVDALDDEFAKPEKPPVEN